jgi:serine/threonine protein kinase
MQNIKHFFEAYQIDYTQSLDKGNAGSVYVAEEVASGNYLAVKVIETHPRFDAFRYQKRYTKAMELAHKYLLPYKTVQRFEEGMVTNFAVMPIVEKGNLEEYWNYYQADLERIIMQVLEGVEYLHENNIVWQQLSATHILLKEYEGQMNAQFINYGDTTKLPLGLFTSYAYLAPEQFGDAPISAQTDIWALGVLLYRLFSGQMPFGERSRTISNERIQERITGDWEPGLMHQIPQPYRLIAEKCLERNLDLRWANCGEIIAAVNNWVPPVEPEVKPIGEELSGERIIKRKPSKPLVWWHIVILFLLAGLLGWYLNKI